MAPVRYYYSPTLGWLAAVEPTVEEQVKKALAEAGQAKREVGVIELTGFALLLFTTAFGVSLAIMRDDHRNPMSSF